MFSLCILDLSWPTWFVDSCFGYMESLGPACVVLWAEGDELGCKGDECWVETDDPPIVLVEAWESPRWVEVPSVWVETCESCT